MHHGFDTEMQAYNNAIHGIDIIRGIWSANALKFIEK